jgi:hypothetical protein
MKRPAALRDAIAGLWSADAAVRAKSGRALCGLAIDMVDIRSAQPALVWAMGDPDPAVRQAAVDATEMRADLGCDVGLAVPALVGLSADPDVELRRRVWRALRYANQRTPFADRIPDVIERGLRDRDSEVVAAATALSGKKPAPKKSTKKKR